jgi:peptidoglycan biosynthesis protein MviN/MurJ (putative lipid II flippase)
MLLLTQRQVGGLSGQHLGQVLAKSLLAGGIMVGTMAIALTALTQRLEAEGLLAGLITVGIVGTAGGLVYLALMSLLRVKEIQLVRDLVRRKLGR